MGHLRTQYVAAASPAPIEGTRRSNQRFTVFAWAVLAWNVVVVLWGAFVRATGSGAGCGNHWPLCNGDIVPRAPAAQTLIEFTHRVTSGLALISVIVLLIWAVHRFPRRHAVRRAAVFSVISILLEALLGAGLVLLQYVEKNASVGRAIYLSAHLANTQLLLAALAVAAWLSRPAGAAEKIRTLRPGVLWILPVTLIVGISGAIAALGDTLFPSVSFSEGVRQELSDSAHFLLRLRVFHPAFALFSAVYVAFLALSIVKQRISPDAVRLASLSAGLVLAQMIAGAVNVLLLAPVWMQLFHLLLADLLWIVLVLLVVEASSSRTMERSRYESVHS